MKTLHEHAEPYKGHGIVVIDMVIRCKYCGNASLKPVKQSIERHIDTAKHRANACTSAGQQSIFEQMGVIADFQRDHANFVPDHFFFSKKNTSRYTVQK